MAMNEFSEWLRELSRQQMQESEKWHKATHAKLDAAAVEAEPLIAQDQFDEAEKIILAVENDIYGAGTLGRLFTAALERCVRRANPDRARAEALYLRARRWRSAYPGVHTESEAEAERAHVEGVEAELRQVLGLLEMGR